MGGGVFTAEHTCMNIYTSQLVVHLRNWYHDWLYIYVTEQNLFYTILDLFFAGSETSTTTTRWAMLYLIHNPDVQAKCQQVIKEVPVI